MNHPTRTTCAAIGAFVTLSALAQAAPAQVPQDPVREIREIVQRIDEQMREIDSWLLQSARKGGTGRKGRELLDKGQQKSEKVVEDIDALIEKLESMRQQSRNRSQSQQEQDQQQQDQQQQDQQQQGQPQQGQRGQRGNRRENQGPDFVQQGEPQGQQPQQGQQEGQQQDPAGGQPTGPEPSMGPGENRPGDRPPGEGTERVPPGTGEGSWGELQSYVNFLKNRGSQPQVPEKFRKYWEAYLREKGKDR
jgi:hypothetical protein